MRRAVASLGHGPLASMIVVENLTFQYHGSGFRLRIPQLRSEAGRSAALIGPSGSGKTTLLHLLAGILRPPPGCISVDSVDPGGLGDAARRRFRISHIGMVFQNFELIEYLNAWDNIRLPYDINSTLRWTADTSRRLRELAELLGIGGLLRRTVGDLSHGEKQRVAIGRALLPSPKLVLADEPTGNLDPENKHRVLQLLLEQARRQQATLLVVTHDHSLLRGFDQVWDFARYHEHGGESHLTAKSS